MNDIRCLLIYDEDYEDGNDDTTINIPFLPRVGDSFKFESMNEPRLSLIVTGIEYVIKKNSNNENHFELLHVYCSKNKESMFGYNPTPKTGI